MGDLVLAFGLALLVYSRTALCLKLPIHRLEGRAHRGTCDIVVDQSRADQRIRRPVLVHNRAHEHGFARPDPLDHHLIDVHVAVRFGKYRFDRHAEGGNGSFGGRLTRQPTRSAPSVTSPFGHFSATFTHP